MNSEIYFLNMKILSWIHFNINFTYSMNILFYMTSSKFSKFESLKNWLEKPESPKNVKYAIILDKFATNNKIFFQMFN